MVYIQGVGVTLFVQKVCSSKKVLSGNKSGSEIPIYVENYNLFLIYVLLS